MEIEGIVYKILPVQSGTSARGEWQKREVVFELPDDRGRKVCVTFFGERAADAASMKEGDKVSVSVNIESREYNGKWYTNVSAWRVNTRAAESPKASVAEQAPFDASTVPAASEPVDDLPF